MLKLFAVGALALFLLLPIVFIAVLIAERTNRRGDAVTEVSQKWGQSQSIVGPVLVVPYLPRAAAAARENDAPPREQELVILPRALNVKGNVRTEERKRGIFTIPVYRADLELSGEFARPGAADLPVDAQSIAWERARLVVGVSDPRAILSGTSLTWNGAPRTFLPGVSGFAAAPAGIHVPVDFSGTAERSAFTVPLAVNGSLGFFLAPLGENTTVMLTSNSGNPSFQGAWLPAQRRISDSGFEARWEIPFLGRNYPQVWSQAEIARPPLQESRFGVEFTDPVDEYRMAERSVKYAGLFILLTFGAVWLMEVLAGLMVHPIQYLLLGAALCLFYLLELSLAEHVGFGPAYAIASVAVIVLIAAYSKAVLGRTSLAVGVGVGVALLYGYLYVLLMIEDYALLAGAVGLFLVLASVMFVTRNVNWYAIGTPRRPTADPAAGSLAR
jgi:inner membrane protein